MWQRLEAKSSSFLSVTAEGQGRKVKKRTRNPRAAKRREAEAAVVRRGLAREERRRPGEQANTGEEDEDDRKDEKEVRGRAEEETALSGIRIDKEEFAKKPFSEEGALRHAGGSSSAQKARQEVQRAQEEEGEARNECPTREEPRERPNRERQTMDVSSPCLLALKLQSHL